MDPHDYESLDSGLDPDGPSAEDLDRFGTELMTCPSCGSEVYDQAELCHVCGHAFERATGGLPVWAVFVAGAVIVALLLLTM